METRTVLQQVMTNFQRLSEAADKIAKSKEHPDTTRMFYEGMAVAFMVSAVTISGVQDTIAQTGDQKRARKITELSLEVYRKAYLGFLDVLKIALEGLDTKKIESLSGLTDD